MARLFPRGAPVCCRPYQGIAQQFIFDYARDVDVYKRQRMYMSMSRVL